MPLTTPLSSRFLDGAKADLKCLLLTLSESSGYKPGDTMPKVKSYSAAWLSKNALGHQLFEPSSDALRSRALSPSYASARKQASAGPRRTIARRGTEVFVAVGKEIRWGDLAYLKEEWSNKQVKAKSGSLPRIKREDSSQSFDGQGEPSNANGLRTIKTPVADDIRQLIISPNKDFLAILTIHTIHICVLPESSHLTSEDTGPLKPKIFTLGPTTHVTSRSPIVTALWHPLGVKGSCIVTVTADAVVRLWELNLTDRWSFDAPTTSVDLKKLADGTTLDQDFSATASTTNKGFSPDSFEMEVAAASFAHEGSGGWNPMTLWIAMREGDVYALCPLLPQRWAPPPTLIPSLTVSIVATLASIEDDPTVAEHEKLLAQQQMQWMGEVDSQDPHVIEGLPGEPTVEVYTRPTRPGVVPRLQGPFDLVSDPETGDELDTSITDIMVIGKKIETDDLMMGEDIDLEFEDSRSQEGISLAVLCLLSTSGQVRIYLDLEGVQAQWLPPKHKTKTNRYTIPETPSLLAFQALDTMSPVEVNEDSWPVFSEDFKSRYNFFVTHHAGITYISLDSWIFRLDGELNGDSEAGTDFRMGLVVNSQPVRDKLYAQSTADAAVPLAASCVLRDPDVGYFLLSATPYDPIALTFETPDDDLAPIRSESPIYERETPIAPLDFYEPRPVFQPSHAFDENSSLPGLLEKLRSSRHKTVVNQEVRLSPLTLQIFTDAHKVLSDETYRLGVAAAEVFRRCELLQSELRQQILKANEVKGKVDAIVGVDRNGESDNAMHERRIAEARARQERLVQRLETLRKTVGKASTTELSAKERAYVEEVKTVQASIATPTEEQAEVKEQSKQLWRRLEDVKRLQAELVGEVESVNKAAERESPSNPEIVIPADIRRTKLQQIQGLLSRETALVEAVTARLERLQSSY
ncbi:Nucleoporin NUP82 [Paramyrothecium foliicola]|nr:Nucleoporin NUP82 [Paramyrothecium foliicola]